MNINYNHPLKDNGFSNTKTNFDYPRHRWYYFKEGFSPNLVDYALQHVNIEKNSDIILDPFNGSGTVTLCSSKKGFRSIGIEVNPFAAFLAKTKLSTADAASLKTQVRRISEGFKKIKTSPLINFSTFSDNGVNEKWLFNPDVLHLYHTAVMYNRAYPGHNVRRLVQFGLISAAMDNCNAVRDGKCLRYKKGWESLNYDGNSFLHSFEARMNMVAEDIGYDGVSSSLSQIYHGDSRSLLKEQGFPRFKFCITSPPYLNSFDYSDVYRPELYLGGFLKNREDLLELRKTSLRSHVFTKKSDLKAPNFGLLYDQTIKGINESQSSAWQRKIPVMVQGYFQDMQSILMALKRKAAEGAQLWIIVANSAYNDIEIPVDLILADIGSKVGWDLRDIGVLRQIHKRGSRYSPDVKSLRESVITFQNKRK